jgi:hypothetical protein
MLNITHCQLTAICGQKCNDSQVSVVYCFTEATLGITCSSLARNTCSAKTKFNKQSPNWSNKKQEQRRTQDTVCTDPRVDPNGYHGHHNRNNQNRERYCVSQVFFSPVRSWRFSDSTTPDAMCYEQDYPKHFPPTRAVVLAMRPRRRKTTPLPISVSPAPPIVLHLAWRYQQHFRMKNSYPSGRPRGPIS